MSVHQAEALTLRTYPYSESHRIVVFLTREFGKIRGIAHGAKKAKSKFGGCLEPLTHLHVTFSRKQHQELSVIRDCEIIRAFPSYQMTLDINLHFGYFAELLTEFGNEEEESDHLFRLALAVLEAMEAVPVPLLARYFELWLLKLEGVLPELSNRLPVDLARKTVGMLKNHPLRLHPDQLNPSEIRRLERLNEELIEYHLEKRLKTKRMLKELIS